MAIVQARILETQLFHSRLDSDLKKTTEYAHVSVCSVSHSFLPFEN